MSNHTYKPGDPIEVRFGGEWHHDGRTYIGEWCGEIVYGRPRHGTTTTSPGWVRPYTPTVEIPEGWTLISNEELQVGVHEVYDPGAPDTPWAVGVVQEISLTGEHLVVARRRADA